MDVARALEVAKVGPATELGAAARALAAELQSVERDLRREWWGNHGHDYFALYGDDGEMSCGMCPADFKRQPIDQLRDLVLKARLSRTAESAS